MKNIFYLLLFAIAVLAGACSANDQFRVNGTLKGKPTMNLRAGYYSDGAYRPIITAAREGEFEFFGSASQPTILEITDYDYRPLGRLYVVNGETYEIHLDPADPYAVEASGNDLSSRWASFLRDNADNMRKHTNATVAGYVGSHPSDVLSTLLLITAFDASGAPEEADSLMALIDPQARPSSLTESYNYLLQRLVTSTALGPVPPMKYVDNRDSLQSFNPARQKLSIITLTTNQTDRTDSIVPALRRMSKRYGKSKLAVLDFSLEPDTMEWKRSTRTDSASWSQGWAAGGLAAMSVDGLGAPSLPFVVLCDSSGTQLYRGPSIGAAEKLINSLLKKD